MGIVHTRKKILIFYCHELKYSQDLVVLVLETRKVVNLTINLKLYWNKCLKSWDLVKSPKLFVIATLRKRLSRVLDRITGPLKFKLDLI